MQGRALIIWRLSDGRRGHDQQSLGLCRAITRLRQTDIHTIRCESGSGLPGFLLGRFPAGQALPAPDLLIGAGHRTHLALLAARRCYGGRAVVLMKPSLPRCFFDLCLVPDHDGVRSGTHTVLTRGPLNTVEPGDARDSAQGLILLGGPSAHVRWEPDRLLRQLRLLFADPATRWNVSDSPRTPAATRAAVAEITAAPHVYIDHRSGGADWLAREMQVCSSIWVTADSMSMLHEALSSGAGTGLLDAGPCRAGRVARALGALTGSGLLTPFTDWDGRLPLPPPAAPLREAQRCAGLLLDRFDLATDRG